MTRVLLVLLLAATLRAEAPELRVGVTLPAYYSWVAVLTAELPVEVVPLAPSGAAHGFRPRPEDVNRLRGIDLLVANGLGHDSWVDRLLQASGRRDLARVDLHAGVPLIPYTGAGRKEAVNPHSFVSLTGAAQQLHNLERALAERLPAHRAALRRNTRALVRRLRALRGLTARSLEGRTDRPVATVHDGYAYLLEELGVEVALVVEPGHGLRPSARELAETATRLREAGVKVLLDEAGLSRRWVRALQEEAGVRVETVEHVHGRFEVGAFEAAMRRNCRAVQRALGAVP